MNPITTFLLRMLTLATLPDDLLVLLSQAESDLAMAKVSDEHHAETVVALQAAQEDEAETAAASFEAHQVAVVSASSAIAALKAHFGIM